MQLSSISIIVTINCACNNYQRNVWKHTSTSIHSFIHLFADIYTCVLYTLYYIIIYTDADIIGYSLLCELLVINLFEENYRTLILNNQIKEKHNAHCFPL